MSTQKTIATYNHTEIESKWQKFWAEHPELSAAVDNDTKRQKLFMLVEFPFPSGAGLHAGHVRSYTALDIIARKARMQGKNVLYPIGWDAFGLPTENYAIKTGVQPAVATKANCDNFEKQLKSLGFSFDWTRTVNTTDPEYYKWTQWIFLQFYKTGLAYRDKISINWCPKDKSGLANEEVIAGCCERCGTKVEKREKEQWMLAITKYADRLDTDLDLVDYPARVKTQQRNWIGRSEGVDLLCEIKDINLPIRMYDSIPQTFFAQTFAVIGADHPLLPKIVSGLPNEKEILEFAKQIIKEKDEKSSEYNDYTKGIYTGRNIYYPAGDRELPLWIASYAVSEYGTGIVSCSAHDERDFAFAKKHNIPLKSVLFPVDDGKPETAEQISKIKNNEIFYREQNGVLAEPAEFKGRIWHEVRQDVIDYLVKSGFAERKVNYKLRDWVFSRQRYWGEPIPVVYCADCGIVPLPLTDLPLILPEVDKYEPTDNGDSPLAAIDTWVNTTCPHCQGPAKRETDTMPNWAGSSWYYLRYADPKNTEVFADPAKLEYWTPVDWYNGGMEHTTLHLLYSRFWHKFLFDQKLVPTSEPYAKRTSHGLIMADDGTKMSKSKGNIVNPDEIVKTYGADTLRLFEMFIGPFEQAVAWNSEGLIGPRRFIERVYKLQEKIATDIDAESGKLSKTGLSLLHKTIKKVTEDIDSLAMNTAVSTLMILANQFEKEESISPKEFEMFLAILTPFIPHVAEEIFANIGGEGSVTVLPWPTHHEKAIQDEDVTIAVQINGKVRATTVVDSETAKSESLVLEIALKLKEVQSRVGDNSPTKVIFVPGKIINLIFAGL